VTGGSNTYVWKSSTNQRTLSMDDIEDRVFPPVRVSGVRVHRVERDRAVDPRPRHRRQLPRLQVDLLHALVLGRLRLGQHRRRVHQPHLPRPSQQILEELVRGPADRRRRHLVHHPRLQPPEISHRPAEPVHLLHGLDQALGGALLLRVEQRLADVERGGHGGSHSSRQSAAHHVRRRVVHRLFVGYLLGHLVHHEVDALEWHVHSQLGGVRAVEGAQALQPVDVDDTSDGGFVRGIDHLHALFYHCKHKVRTRTTGGRWGYLLRGSLCRRVGGWICNPTRLKTNPFINKKFNTFQSEFCLAKIEDW
jgi:hypothetical protein